MPSFYLFMTFNSEVKQMWHMYKYVLKHTFRQDIFKQTYQNVVLRDYILTLALYTVHCTVGCPKMQLFFMSRCIWLVRLLENDFTFTIFDFVHYSSERCSKTKTKFFLHGAQSFLRNAAEIIKTKFADFLFGSKYEKW